MDAKDACLAVGAMWSPAVWTPTGIWNSPEGGWTGDSHTTDRVHTTSGAETHECFDADVTDHVGTCTNSAGTDTIDCSAMFSAANTFEQESCLTAAPHNCTWTAAPRATTPKPAPPVADNLAGYTFRSGACRGPTLNDRPPYAYRKNTEFPNFPAWAEPSALTEWCNELNDAHALNNTTNPASCLGFHSGPWVSVFGVGMNVTDPGISSDWAPDNGNGNDPSGDHYHPGGNDALLTSNNNGQYGTFETLLNSNRETCKFHLC